MEKHISEPNHNPNAKIDDAIRQEVIRIAAEWLSDTDPSRNTAIIMIAALFCGPDVDAIATTMGIDSGFVQCVADRMRASKLWTVAGGVDYADWLAGDYLGIANFALDLEVAEGVFTRGLEKENGQYGYTLVAEGPDATLDEKWDGAVFTDPKSSID